MVPIFYIWCNVYVILVKFFVHIWCNLPGSRPVQMVPVFKFAGQHEQEHHLKQLEEEKKLGSRLFDCEKICLEHYAG